MKLPWYLFVLGTVVLWGAYVPTLHTGQKAFPAPRQSALRAFLFVGAAYFVVSTAVLLYLVMTRAEPMQFSARGVSLSTLAGALGALGALGIVFALKSGGSALIVAPLVFAGAPIVNTFVSMMWHRPEKVPDIRFFLGILLAVSGAWMVLRFRPDAPPPSAPAAMHPVDPAKSP